MNFLKFFTFTKASVKPRKEALKGIQNAKFGRVLKKSFNLSFEEASFEGPLLHVGAKINYEDEKAKAGAERLRVFYAENLLANQESYGLDIFAGHNVDIVADLCDEELFFGDLSRYEGYFKTIICWALLEHVQNPFVAAKNIERFMAPGGKLFYAGPWVWGYHPYPDDFWRISFSGLKVLFPSITWEEWWYSGTSEGVGYQIKEIRNERKVFQWVSDPTKKMDTANAISDRYMPYLNINAIGVKGLFNKAESAHGSDN